MPSAYVTNKEKIAFMIDCYDISVRYCCNAASRARIHPWRLGNSAARPPCRAAALLSTPLYWLYEMSHAALNPSRAVADATRLLFQESAQSALLHHLRKIGRRRRRSCSSARRAATAARSGGSPRRWSAASACRCISRRVWERPFCRLLHFERVVRAPAAPAAAAASDRRADVGPLRDVAARHGRGVSAQSRCLHHRVGDARTVPLSEGRFDLDDYIDYVISMLHALGGETHVVAVCQPAVPVLAAAALMEADDDPYAPISMTLMGGPIDTRVNPTAVNTLAAEARHRLVPPQRHHQGAVSQSRIHARRLSGLSAAPRLHQHEPRSAYRGAPGSVPQSGERRRRLGAEAQGILRRISRGHGSGGRVSICRRSTPCSCATRCRKAK